jgi:hypothetical protein
MVSQNGKDVEIHQSSEAHKFKDHDNAIKDLEVFQTIVGIITPDKISSPPSKAKKESAPSKAENNSPSSTSVRLSPCW